LRAVEGQIEVVIMRCRVCRERRPSDTPTALLRLMRTPEGRWQVDRLERLSVARQPWALGVSPLGDPRWGVETFSGTQIYPVPVDLPADPDEPITVSCRGCDREPFPVQYARIGRRALARGLGEVDR
jgi:hypothetical protein